MNVQPSQLATHALNVDKIDRLGLRQEVPRQELTPPSYGEDHRKFIDTCVEGLVSDLCRRIEDLRGQLKTVEQQVLASAEKARGALREHAAVCVRINDEVCRVQGVVADLKAETHEP